LRCWFHLPQDGDNAFATKQADSIDLTNKTFSGSLRRIVLEQWKVFEPSATLQIVPHGKASVCAEPDIEVVQAGLTEKLSHVGRSLTFPIWSSELTESHYGHCRVVGPKGKANAHMFCLLTELLDIADDSKPEETT
jgi:hypothetical protein